MNDTKRPPVAVPGEVTLSKKNLDGVLFDLDGVLTNTARIHAAAWKELFDGFMAQHSQQSETPQRPFSQEDYYRYVDGKPRYDGVRSFLGSRGVNLPQGDPKDSPDVVTVCGLGNRKNRYFTERLRAGDPVEVYPSSVELVKSLMAHRFKVGLVSSSRNCRTILKAAGIEDLFPVVVDGRDAMEHHLAGKPDPAMFLEAARRLDLGPQRAAVFEDAVSGTQAAQNGGFVLVIGVNRTDQAEALLRNGAHLVVSDLAQVQVSVEDGA